jgi:hypothetical protein
MEVENKILMSMFNKIKNGKGCPPVGKISLNEIT